MTEAKKLEDQKFEECVYYNSVQFQFQFHSQEPPPKISDRRLQVDYGVLKLHLFS